MKLCIIGGSTSGWWTAGFWEKHMPDWDVTIYDAPTIPALGVGESCLPQLKWWWESMGITEDQWMDKGNALYKYGNYKEGWNTPDPEKDDPFVTRFWFNDDNIFDKMYADKSNWKNGNINKQIFYDEFDTPDKRADYAYHVCAESTAYIVKQTCQKTKVIEEEVTSLPDGYDLYIDCTGFSRKFVKDKTPMKLHHQHFVDSAWINPCHTDEKLDRDVTKSIARKYGWEFEISLQNRVGMGYVYSSSHVDEEKALDEFLENQKNQGRKPLGEPRQYKWKPLVFQNPWSDNVVAIGSSAGFVDPLEATTLFMTQAGITQLVKTIKKGYRKESYNRVMRRIWNDGIRFILAHYQLSKRTDTKFWLDSKNVEMKKNIWDYYEKYTSSYQWIFPSGTWCQLGTYFNEFDYYRPKG